MKIAYVALYSSSRSIYFMTLKSFAIDYIDSHEWKKHNVSVRNSQQFVVVWWLVKLMNPLSMKIGF